jgi:N utilization substance protein A
VTEGLGHLSDGHSTSGGIEMKSELELAFNQICSDRSLSKEVVLGALEMALVSAYRRSIGASSEMNITASFDLDTQEARIYIHKEVAEEVEDPELQISLDEARGLQPEAGVGDTVTVEDVPGEYGRIEAQSAKQIILQRIREAEREARYAQYVQQEGEIVHGTVQNISPAAVTLHLEGTEAILPRREQVPGERYTMHQRLRAYVVEVRKASRGPQIIVSRSHKNMLRRLLELEVPEIFSGAVEIKSIAREAGSRSKVAVAARQAGVDPVGACVGMRGVRVQSIVNELNGEKVDIIEWSPDAGTFIAKALSPAKVLSVQLEEDPQEGKTASVIVPDDQLSLAIGRNGQNARLAAKLTSWRIDIQGVTEAAAWALERVNEDANVLPSLGAAAEHLPGVAAILRQHEQERMPYNSEELLLMRQVIQAVWSHYASLRNAERARLMAEEAARQAAIEAAEAERRAAIESAQALIPAEAYEISLGDMEISARVLGHLQKANLEDLGQVMERLAEGDEGLLRVDGIGPKSLGEVKEAIDQVDLPEVEPVPAEEPAAVEAAAEEELEVEAEPAAEPAVEAVEEEATAAEAGTEAEEPARPELVPAEMPAVEEEEGELEQEFEEDLEAKRKRDRRKRRALVFDEELGVVVSRRRHKRGSDVEDWDELSR